MDFKTSSPAVYNGYLGQLYNKLSSETERGFFLNSVLKESQGQRKDCLETCEGQDVLQTGRGFEKQRMLLFIYYQVLTTSNSSCREFLFIYFFLPSIYLVQNVFWADQWSLKVGPKGPGQSAATGDTCLFLSAAANQPGREVELCLLK